MAHTNSCCLCRLFLLPKPTTVCVCVCRLRHCGSVGNMPFQYPPQFVFKCCIICRWQQICCALLYSRLQTLHHSNIIFLLGETLSSPLSELFSKCHSDCHSCSKGMRPVMRLAERFNASVSLSAFFFSLSVFSVFLLTHQKLLPVSLQYLGLSGVSAFL